MEKDAVKGTASHFKAMVALDEVEREYFSLDTVRAQITALRESPDHRAAPRSDSSQTGGSEPGSIQGQLCLSAALSDGSWWDSGLLGESGKIFACCSLH